MAAERAPEPHPDVQRVIDLREAADLPEFHECTPAEARQVLETVAAVGAIDADVASVEDRTIDGPAGDLAVRVYEPAAPDGARPIVCYYHGGGWVLGSLDTADGICRTLADATGYPVVGVDYRLAPEHPFPAGLLDCHAAFEWLAGTAPDLGGDPDRIVLAGDSAGGNLAAGVSLLARDRGGVRPAHQLLAYPVTGDPTATDAYEENARDYLLTTADAAWFEDHYFEREVDRRNGYALPRQLHDLSGLAPATVLTAGFDPLRDDGAAYAERLADCGVAVTHRNYPDLVHGFLGMVGDPVDVAPVHGVYDDVAGGLRDALE